jgi:hypothetical protein
MKDYVPQHFRPFTDVNEVMRELEAMSIQYGLPIAYLMQEFVVDGILQIDTSYVPPACSN